MPSMMGRIDTGTTCPRESAGRRGSPLGRVAASRFAAGSMRPRPMASMERRGSPAPRSCAGSGVLSCIEKGSDTGLQLGERQFAYRRATAEQQQAVRNVAVRKDGSEPAPEAITRHGVAHGTVECKADLGRRDSRIIDERAPHRCVPHTDTVAPEADKSVTITDSIDQARRSGRQSGAALVPSGLQHGATCPSAHAGAKTVLAVAASVVGLECTLHDDLFRRFRTMVR